jgi:hypothetical protein
LIWFLQTVRAKILLPALFIAGLGSPFLREINLIVPMIGAQNPFGPLPLKLVVPLACIVALGSVQSIARSPSSRTASRRLGLMMTSYTLLGSGVFAAGSVIGVTVIAGQPDLDVIRNVSVLVALLLVGEVVLGMKHSPLALVGFVFLSTVFGRNQFGVAQPWAWLVQPATAADLSVALVVLVGAAFIAVVASLIKK